MYIMCANNQLSNIPLTKVVNKVSKYIYMHLDNAYNLTYRRNCCDVYLTLYYQSPGYDFTDSMNELGINLNVTTYQNKIRVNLIEMTEYEKTISSDTYVVDKYNSIEELCNDIINKMKKKIRNEFSMFDFIF